MKIQGKSKSHIPGSTTIGCSKMETNMERIELAVTLLARFGWLRFREMGLFLFPNIGANEGSRRTVTRRVVSRLKELKYIETYPLPAGSRAIFLTSLGAKFARELGQEFFNGFSWRTLASDWAHDCFVAQMVYAITGGAMDRFLTEFEILCADGPNIKRPDGLVWWNGQWHLIEIEHSRKSGANLRQQADRVKRVVMEGAEFAGQEVTGAMLCYPTNIPGISHRTRLINAMNDAGLRDSAHPDIKLIGFHVSSPTHSVIKLSEKQGVYLLAALEVEVGLPPEIDTGQRRGPRIQYTHTDVSICRLDSSDPAAFFEIENARAWLISGEDNIDVCEVLIEVDGEQTARLIYPQPILFDDAISNALETLYRLQRDDESRFIPPRKCFH